MSALIGTPPRRRGESLSDTVAAAAGPWLAVEPGEFGERTLAVSRTIRRGDTLTDRRFSDRSVGLLIKHGAAAGGVCPRKALRGLIRARYATVAAGLEERTPPTAPRPKRPD